MARDPLTAPVPKGSALRQFTMTMLILEILVVLFAGVTAFGLRLAPAGTVWTLTGIGMAVLLLAAIVLGRSQRAGIILGSFAQAVVLVTGVWMPAGFAVGLSFLALWSASIYWGSRLDREREERRAEQAAWEAEHGGESDVSGA